VYLTKRPLLSRLSLPTALSSAGAEGKEPTTVSGMQPPLKATYYRGINADKSIELVGYTAFYYY
jgi:hypothetical protein